MVVKNKHGLFAAKKIGWAVEKFETRNTVTNHYLNIQTLAAWGLDAQRGVQVCLARSITSE